MLFGAEGYQEYAAATGDDEARRRAVDLVHRVYNYLDGPKRSAADGVRTLGQWFITLQVITSLLKRWPDPALEKMADRCVDVIVHKHFNPEIGLFTEVRNYDFTPAEGEATKTVLGHAMEACWILMFEAQRRKDSALFAIAAERMRRHFEVAWDNVYGGIAEAVNVDHGGYVWPLETPPDTELKFQFTGEYSYTKSMWAEDEALIALFHIYEVTGAPWTLEYFSKVYKLVQEKFSMEKYGYATYMMFCDRKMTLQTHATRQENYHNPRQFMFNLVAVERMLKQNRQMTGQVS